MTRDADTEIELDPEDVARRAHQRYVERGYEDGFDLDDWFEAERELREELEDKAGDQPVRPVSLVGAGASG